MACTTRIGPQGAASQVDVVNVKNRCWKSRISGGGRKAGGSGFAGARLQRLPCLAKPIDRLRLSVGSLWVMPSDDERVARSGDPFCRIWDGNTVSVRPIDCPRDTRRWSAATGRVLTRTKGRGRFGGRAKCFQASIESAKRP